jgi:hypothetical protein
MIKSALLPGAFLGTQIALYGKLDESICTVFPVLLPEKEVELPGALLSRGIGLSGFPRSREIRGRL